MLKTTTISIVFVFYLKFVTCQVRYLRWSVEEGNDTDGRILGGFTAKDGQFPYQVQIRVNNMHHCGGSILNNLWILTAGHCIDGIPLQNLDVVVGTIDITGGIFYRVVQPILHEGYEPEPSLSNDIALLRVDRPIDFRYNIQPIRLASNALTPGFTCTISGWGYVNSRTFTDTPRFLQYLYQDLVGLDECRRKYHTVPSITPPVRITHICAFNDRNRAICYGDSGGSLVCGGVQYGIASFLANSCGTGIPDVYTSVYAYRSWIALKSDVNV